MAKIRTMTSFLAKGDKSSLFAGFSATHPAFTIAELAITITVIGVVAAITMPLAYRHFHGIEFETANKKLQLFLAETLEKMNADQALTGYTTTQEFVDAFRDFASAINTCPSDDLTGCFPETFKVGEEEFSLSDIKGAEFMGKTNWNTNVEGLILKNGVKLLIAYNPSCSKKNSSNCASILYDLNSVDKDNVYLGNGLSDLGTFNAEFTNGSSALQCGENATSDGIVWYDPMNDYYNYYSRVIMDGPDGATQACIEANMDKIRAYCSSGGYGMNNITIYEAQNTYMDVYDWHVQCTICFPEGTLVAMADGSQKRIEDIDYDDDLLVWDFDNAKMSSSKPVWIKKPEVVTKYNVLKFSDGSELRTVKRHRIFNKEEGRFTYTMEDETPLGTTTLNAKGEEVTLISKEVVEEPVVYYNLITANHFNCFTSNILTSNRFNNLYPIQDYKFVKDNRELTPYSEYENFVSREWYEKLRLAEQTCDEDMKLYLSNLVRLNKRQLALV